MKRRANVEFVPHAPQSAGSLAGFTRQHANYRHVTPRTWRKSWDKIGLTNPNKMFAKQCMLVNFNRSIFVRVSCSANLFFKSKYLLLSLCMYSTKTAQLNPHYFEKFISVD